MKLGQSSKIRPGEFVIAMGSPLALSNTITTGVVSSVARRKTELGLKEANLVPDYIQTDAAVSYGNSGGPLINLDGEAIGINSLNATSGISFAIPIDYAKEFLQKREKFMPCQKRKFMGISMMALTPQVQERFKEQLPAGIHQGIVVVQVVQNSPADQAGIQAGDVITHINGIQIKEAGHIYELLEMDIFDLFVHLVRNDQSKKLTVRPVEQI